MVSIWTGGPSPFGGVDKPLDLSLRGGVARNDGAPNFFNRPQAVGHPDNL